MQQVPFAQAAPDSTLPPAGIADSTRPPAHWLTLLGRHQIGGLAATLLDFTAMSLVVEWLGGNAELGTVAGAAMGAVANFLLGRHWVFRGAGGRAAVGQAARYALISLASLVGNTMGEYVLHERWGVQYQLARVVVAVIVSVVWNFPMQRHFVFAAEPRPRWLVPRGLASSSSS
jgi:putative flippase GtrA